MIALAYPAASSWQWAWQVYHAWPNAHSFVTAFTPVAAQSRGLIYVSGTEPQNIAEYYTPQGLDWTRWTAALSLDPAAVAPSAWESHYTSQLNSGNYGVIVLFYPTTFSSAPELPGGLLLSPHGGTNRELLDLVGQSSGEPGLRALTRALEKDPDYQLVADGPFDSAHDYSIYAVWQKVQT